MVLWCSVMGSLCSIHGNAILASLNRMDNYFLLVLCDREGGLPLCGLMSVVLAERAISLRMVWGGSGLFDDIKIAQLQDDCAF